MNGGIFEYIYFFIFSMVFTKGSGSGVGGQDRPWLTHDQIGELITTEVATTLMGSIPEMFGSIKTTMIELFNDFYVSLIEAVAAAATVVVTPAVILGDKSFQYWDFDNTKPPDFDRFKEPNVAMSWLFDVEGCFFTSSCPNNQKVKFALNLLRLRRNIGGYW